MSRGPASMEGANKKPPASIDGGWWRDGWPVRSADWGSEWRASQYELGTRALGYLKRENRRSVAYRGEAIDMRCWPPALEEADG